MSKYENYKCDFVGVNDKIWGTGSDGNGNRDFPALPFWIDFPPIRDLTDEEIEKYYPGVLTISPEDKVHLNPDLRLLGK